MYLDSANLGTKPTLTFTFRDVDGALTNPGPLTLQVQEPDGTETDYSTGFTQQSTGVYTWTFPAVLTQAGRYYVRVVDDTSVGFSEEGSFSVPASEFSALPS